MLPCRPGDWGGKCEDSWFFLRKSGIPEAMFSAVMAMIWGHSNLRLIPGTTADKNCTQQPTGGDRCRIWLSVGPYLDVRKVSSNVIFHLQVVIEGALIGLLSMTRQSTGDISRDKLVVNTTRGTILTIEETISVSRQSLLLSCRNTNNNQPNLKTRYWTVIVLNYIIHYAKTRCIYCNCRVLHYN